MADNMIIDHPELSFLASCNQASTCCYGHACASGHHGSNASVPSTPFTCPILENTTPYSHIHHHEGFHHGPSERRPYVPAGLMPFNLMTEFSHAHNYFDTAEHREYAMRENLITFEKLQNHHGHNNRSTRQHAPTPASRHGKQHLVLQSTDFIIQKLREKLREAPYHFQKWHFGVIKLLLQSTISISHA
jgi:hypothetical protein